MTSLPSQLLNQLLTELSTLASVYHKPPESFVGQGRYGADRIQQAAIQEARQNAVENPIAATVAAAANGLPTQNNAENLLDIDFDGAAPASADLPPAQGSSGLEGLAGTPQRVASPAVNQVPSSLADMMGLFDNSGAPPQTQATDLMNGLAGMDMNGSSQPSPPPTQLNSSKKTTEDLLGMF